MGCYRESNAFWEGWHTKRLRWPTAHRMSVRLMVAICSKVPVAEWYNTESCFEHKLSHRICEAIIDSGGIWTITIRFIHIVAQGFDFILLIDQNSIRTLHAIKAEEFDHATQIIYSNSVFKNWHIFINHFFFFWGRHDIEIFQVWRD